LIAYHTDRRQQLSAVAEIGDRLATTDMDQKVGAVSLLGELSPHLTQCGLGWGLPPYQLLPSGIPYNPPNRLAAIHQRHRQI